MSTAYEENRKNKPDDDKYEVGPYNLSKVNFRSLLNKYTFPSQPMLLNVTATAHGLVDGTDEDIAIHQYADGLQLYLACIGTHTVHAPLVNANGLDYNMTATNNVGVSWVMQHITHKGIEGITKFTIGLNAFYAKLKFACTDVSGADDCAFGFRKVQAHNKVFDDHTDFAVLNNISGTIKQETDLNGVGTTTTANTDSWADTETHTLEVYVSIGGVASYKIDGVAPTVAPTVDFTFDLGDVVTPFFFLLNDATTPAAVVMQELEAGIQV